MYKQVKCNFDNTVFQNSLLFHVAYMLKCRQKTGKKELPVTTTLRRGREGGGAKCPEEEKCRTSGSCLNGEKSDDEKMSLLLLLVLYNHL